MRSRALFLLWCASCSVNTPVFEHLNEQSDADVDDTRQVVRVPPDPSPLDATCQNAMTGPYEASLPAPADVQVEQDHHSARLAWDGSLTRSNAEIAPSIEGYRVCWGPSVDDLRYASLFTARRGQLFGVSEGTTFVAVVQAVDALGRASPPSEPVTFAHDDTRVTALASDMTGFFDDFNWTRGALDERRWNVAASACNDPTASHIYIGSQEHALSVLGSHTFLPGSSPGCDRNQVVARPRAVFDFTAREGRITFDLAGSEGGRGGWFIDVLPADDVTQAIDLTGHNELDPTGGHPGRFLRFSQLGYGLRLYQHDATGAPVSVVQTTFDAARDQTPLPGHLMRHWELRVRQDYAAIYVDGVLIVENTSIALDFERAIVHVNQFGFEPSKAGFPWHMVQWDNFGFDGPAQALVTHNYKAAWSAADRVDVGWPNYTGSFSITIPDDFDRASGARLFYTLQTLNYQWTSSDSLTVNDTVIPMPEPQSPTGTWMNLVLGFATTPFSTSVEVSPQALRRGVNTVSVNATSSTLLNQHIEIYFAPEQAPPFTQPETYLAGSGLPALGPPGPFARIDSVNDELCHDRDGILDITYDETGDETRLSLSTPLSGIVSVGIDVDTSRSTVMLANNPGIARVELLVDGAVVASVDTNASVPTPRLLTAPNALDLGGITLSFDSTLLPNGAHTIEPRAYDSHGFPSRPSYDAAGVMGLGPAERAPVHVVVQNP